MTLSPARLSFFRKIFPGCFGLLVYFTVRLLQDSVSGLRFWRRSWTVTLPELLGSILIGYTMIGLVHGMLRWFDRQRTGTARPPAVGKEIAGIILLNLVVQNAVFTPLAAFTDDGLQWGDLVAINVIPMLYSMIYYGYRRSRDWLAAYTDQKIRAEKLENDQLATELRFLRAQYHPHFLFNALNTIYFQMDEDVPQAKKTLEQFSELLRYQLYDQQEKVSLQREIGYLSNYIALQKARTDDKLRLDLSLPGEELPVTIFPLLLLPLVENAFKYAGGELTMSIRLDFRQNQLRLRVENSTGWVPAGGPGGIGLENLRRRLLLLYPGKHHFESGPCGENRWLATLSLETS